MGESFLELSSLLRRSRMLRLSHLAPTSIPPSPRLSFFRPSWPDLELRPCARLCLSELACSLLPSDAAHSSNAGIYSPLPTSLLPPFCSLLPFFPLLHNDVPTFSFLLCPSLSFTPLRSLHLLSSLLPFFPLISLLDNTHTLSPLLLPFLSPLYPLFFLLPHRSTHALLLFPPFPPLLPLLPPPSFLSFPCLTSQCPHNNFFSA